jgi:hypothetical protein
MHTVMRIATVMAITACVIAVLGVNGGAQVDVIVSRGVDTMDVDKRAVLTLWTEYLDSKPDILWSDHDWDGEKGRFWLDFDLTAPFVYQFGADSFLRTYRPTVMAIEREGDLYSIRTLFYAEGLDSASVDRNPWAIVRVYAQRVGGQWKLRNALGVLTEDWNRPAIGKLTFVSPPAHDFDIRLARKSVSFCDSISKLFPFFAWDSFYFFVTHRREDVDRIIGLDYFHAGFPWARAMRPFDVLITGRGSEWYPQGLVQMLATGPDLAPHAIVADGFVGWVGGWNDRTYEDNMREVAAYMSANPSLSFQSFLDGEVNSNSKHRKYFPGAVVCDVVYAAAGVEGIEILFKAGRRDEDLFNAIQSTTGLGRTEFMTQWRQRVLAFAD